MYGNIGYKVERLISNNVDVTGIGMSVELIINNVECVFQWT